jgi:hypothetical protein
MGRAAADSMRVIPPDVPGPPAWAGINNAVDSDAKIIKLREVFISILAILNL